MLSRIKHILLQSDLSLSTFVLGIALVLWGVIAFFMVPLDLVAFVGDFSKGTPLLWAINYVVAGIGFVWVTLKGFPAMSSLLVGCYCCVMWTWIASVRNYSSNLTSGLTLNLVVIFLALLLIQRSGCLNRQNNK